MRRSGPFDDGWPKHRMHQGGADAPIGRWVAPRTTLVRCCRNAGPDRGWRSRGRPRGPTPSPPPAGATPSPPDVVPRNGRRAARAPRAGSHPERRHAHARSRVTVAPARTPDGLLVRLVLLAGVIWRDRSARALWRRLVGQPRGLMARSVTDDQGSWSSAAGLCRRRRRIRGWFVADDDRGGITVQAPGLPGRLPSVNNVSGNQR